MNNVILFMWLADITGNVQELTGWGLLIWLVVSLLGTFATGSFLAETTDVDEKAVVVNIWRYWRWSLFVAASFMFIYVLAPSRDTMRLGAAFSAGKVVIDSHIGQKAGEAANAILDRIINEAKPKDSK